MYRGVFMSSLILGALMIFLSIAGLISITKAVISLILTPKNDTSVVVVSSIGKNCENAEFILRSWGERSKWQHGKNLQKIICLDRGMDENTRRICKSLSAEYENMSVMTVDELKNEFEIP